MGMGGNFNIITSSNAENINLRTLLDAAGFNNDIPARITYTLNASINVTSAASTGTATPAWQTGTIGSIHTVTVYINGAVKGYGGAGGSGGGFNANGSVGATGGTAMSFACDATLIVNSGGSVLAGGGGGGGGGGASMDNGDENPLQAAGGNGGLGAGTASAANGADGAEDCDGSTCAEGGDGGDGGAHGAAGSTGGDGNSGGKTGGAGGAGGYAVAKNSNTVTTTNNGTISGTQG